MPPRSDGQAARRGVKPLTGDERNITPVIGSSDNSPFLNLPLAARPITLAPAPAERLVKIFPNF